MAPGLPPSSRACLGMTPGEQAPMSRTSVLTCRGFICGTDRESNVGATLVFGYDSRSDPTLCQKFCGETRLLHGEHLVSARFEVHHLT